MANKPLNMSKVRQVIQLHQRGKSNKFISGYLSISRNTVIKYLSLYKVMGIPFKDLMNRSDAELENLFISNVTVAPCERIKQLHAFFPYMERNLKKICYFDESVFTQSIHVFMQYCIHIL